MGIVAIPLMLLLYDPATVIALTTVITLGTTRVVIAHARRGISWRRLAMVPPALVGLFLGAGCSRRSIQPRSRRSRG